MDPESFGMKETEGFGVLRKKLRRMKPEKLDELFHTLHEEVFAQIDCLSCAACCKTISPAVRDVDITRLSKTLKMKPSEISEKYFYRDEEGDYVFHDHPCPFLLSDNKCAVYQSRPGACREYPHTDRVHMHQILELTFRNASVCPAVKEILKKIASAEA